MTSIDTCNTCGCTFDGEHTHHASLKNREYAATFNEDGEVIQECCEMCQQEIFDAIEEDEDAAQ